MRSLSGGEHSTKLCVVLILGIFILAMGLRLWGIDFGSGLNYHSDEQFKLKDIITLLSGDSLEDPFSFTHPTFMRRYAAAVSQLVSDISSHPADYVKIHLISRICIAFLGALTVVPVFFIGKVLESEKLGFMSAFILAVVPTHVIHSHYLKEDIPQTFWLALFLLFALQIIRSGALKYYVLAGLAGGFALATKYPSAVMVPVPLFAAHMINRLKEKDSCKSWIIALVDWRLYISVLVIILTFAIVSFDLLINFSAFLQGLNYEFAHASKGHFGIRISSLPLFFTYHLRFSLWPGMTPLLLVMSFSGMLAALYMKRKDADKVMEIAWLLFTLAVFYLTVEIPVLKPPGFQRYVMPCIPILSLFAAWTFIFFISHKHVFVKYAGIIISSLIVLYSGFMAARYDSEMVPDTRDVSAGWMETWISGSLSPNESIMLFGQYDSNLPYQIMKSGKFNNRISWSSSLDDIFMREPDYIVVSSLNYDRYFQYKRYGQRYSMDLEIYYRFYRILFDTHELVMSFSSSLPKLGINNPDIIIYRADYEELKALWTI